MKALSSNKNVSTIQRKLTRKFKPLPTITNLHSLTLIDVSQVFFKTQITPVTLEFQTHQYKEVSLIVTASSATIKNSLDSNTIPLNIGKSKWIRIVLGPQIKNVQIKSSQSQIKLDKTTILSKLQTWKTVSRQDPCNLHNLYLQPLLILLKTKINKRDKQFDMPPKSSISSFMKTRFSQRNAIKGSLLPFRAKHETVTNHLQFAHNINSANLIEKMDKKQYPNINMGYNKERQHGSSTLQIDRTNVKSKYFANMKESNTSTSISVQPQIKFTKRMKRMKEITELKVTKSQKETMFQDASELFSINQKPKFYQHINLSQEELELKRKKFDSQFIVKKQVDTTLGKEFTSLENNQSEVTEDICKVQNSKMLNNLQDTLENGFVGNNPGNQLDQQSGTLCQSVFE